MRLWQIAEFLNLGERTKVRVLARSKDWEVQMVHVFDRTVAGTQNPDANQTTMQEPQEDGEHRCGYDDGSTQGCAGKKHVIDDCTDKDQPVGKIATCQAVAHTPSGTRTNAQ